MEHRNEVKYYRINEMKLSPFLERILERKNRIYALITDNSNQNKLKPMNNEGNELSKNNKIQELINSQKK